jgi:exoribonuclease R
MENTQENSDPPTNSNNYTRVHSHSVNKAFNKDSHYSRKDNYTISKNYYNNYNTSSNNYKEGYHNNYKDYGGSYSYYANQNYPVGGNYSNYTPGNYSNYNNYNNYNYNINLYYTKDYTANNENPNVKKETQLDGSTNRHNSVSYSRHGGAGGMAGNKKNSTAAHNTPGTTQTNMNTNANYKKKKRNTNHVRTSNSQHSAHMHSANNKMSTTTGQISKTNTNTILENNVQNNIQNSHKNNLNLNSNQINNMEQLNTPNVLTTMTNAYNSNFPNHPIGVPQNLRNNYLTNSQFVNFNVNPNPNLGLNFKNNLLHNHNTFHNSYTNTKDRGQANINTTGMAGVSSGYNSYANYTANKGYKGKCPSAMKKLIFVNQYQPCMDFASFKVFINLNLKFLKQNYKFKENQEEDSQNLNNLNMNFLVNLTNTNSKNNKAIMNNLKGSTHGMNTMVFPLAKNMTPQMQMYLMALNNMNNMPNFNNQIPTNLNSQNWSMLMTQMQNYSTMKDNDILTNESPVQGLFFHNPYVPNAKGKSELVQEEKDNKNENETLPSFTDKILEENLSSGRFLKGVIRINKCHTHGYITVQGLDNDILIRGNRNLNQSLHLDEVVVELFPMMCWKPLFNKKPRKFSNQKDIPGSTQTDLEDLEEYELPEDEARQSRFKENFENIDERLRYINKVYNLRPEGRIVKISSSPNSEKNQIVKIICEKSLIFAFPIDENLPKIFIKMKKFRRVEFVKKLENDNYFKNKYFLVKIVGWALNFKCPKGIIVNELGNCGDVDVETSVLLRTHEIDYDENYPEEAMKEIRKIESDDLKDRIDLRSEIIFPIDPKNSKDLDDAIGVEIIDQESGLLEIGVHIADPSHFVTENSLLDKEAMKRATTIYLVHKNIPMLPRQLSEDLCSLFPNCDRLAFSLKFRIFLNGALDLNFTPKFFLSVINCSAKWNYELAQRIIDNEDPELIYQDLKEEDGTLPRTKEIFYKMVEKVKILHKLTKLVRFQRIESGSLIIENKEVRFILNENNNNENLKENKLNTDNLVNLVNINSAHSEIPSDYIKQNNEGKNNNSHKNSIKENDLQEMSDESDGTNINEHIKNNNNNFSVTDNYFNFEPSHSKILPVGFKLKSKLDSNNLIEELMLIANKLTAEYLYENLKECALIRRHAFLNDSKFSEIQRYFGQNKLNADLEDPQALNNLLMKIKGNNLNKFICIQHKLRSFMQRAEYVVSGNYDFDDLRHSALNFDLYTHFTSPIRRYPDLIVHRQLKHILSGNSTKLENYSRHADEFNEKYFNSKSISSKSQKIFHCILLKNLPPTIYKALVVDILYKPTSNKNRTYLIPNQMGTSMINGVNINSPQITVNVFIPELSMEIVSN